MRLKTISKLITTLLIIITILSTASIVFAAREIDSHVDDGGGGGGSSGGIYVPEPTLVGDTGIESTVGNVIGVFQTICYAAAVILLIILGVKFMVASPEGKAEVKKSAIIYGLGATLVFAAGMILQLLKNVAEGTIVAS